MDLDEAAAAVVRVGAGRGFVIQCSRGRLIITAAHCLPDLPPAMSFSLVEERTYPSVLGGIEVEPTIAAECLFVDPVADIAVLGEPDGQLLPGDGHAYGEMVEACAALPVSAATTDAALLLYLDGNWRPCALREFMRGYACDTQLTIHGGMSGSPILNTEGAAIGVVATNQGPHPRLANHLPAWLARNLFSAQTT